MYIARTASLICSSLQAPVAPLCQLLGGFGGDLGMQEEAGCSFLSKFTYGTAGSGASILERL